MIHYNNDNNAYWSINVQNFETREHNHYINSEVCKFTNGFEGKL